MSSRTRALAIGLMGPAISGLGFLAMFVEAALDPSPEKASVRYLLFDSPHLVIAIGIIVSAFCLPIAVRVATADAEEVEMPVFGEEMEPDLEPEGAPGRRLAPQ